MTATRFPIERTLAFPQQEDRREFVFMACEGHPPERKRKLVLEAVAAGILNRQDAEIFLDNLGLLET